MNAREPIAVVGMACRFAGGVHSPEQFWSLLREGRDAIGEVPPERWEWYASRSRADAAALAGATRQGAFLDDIRGFDADFFDVTPREAELMDPQQRIVLELAWEALEHAAVPAHALAGGDAGVFVGVGSDDYGRRMLEDLPRIEAWTGIGGSYCGVANRVSYALDLRGPSMAVDTACSSSLVALHLAMQSLRAGECPLALAGGVLVMASPGLTLVLDEAGATAPDGRCKSFAAAGDGYGRGEGGGLLVLKRLSDARRDGDRVLAVLRGSAVHQDGRTRGIMAPNGEAQAHLLRRTYESAQIDPASVDYVEAHGTGTRAGDPLEAGAMSSVFGAGRAAGKPCLIGSVKPNIGHLEAGAGIAGVIKTVLALQHGQIPPSLNCETPNPAVDWAGAGLRVVTEATPWPDRHTPRRAGVSGYGYGGTLAHVIVEQAPDADAPDACEPGLALYPLSGANACAVQEYAGRLAGRLAEPVATAGVGHTLAVRRHHLPHRAAVVAADRAQLARRLAEFAGQGLAPGVSTGCAAGAGRGLVWVFSGHGSQWTGMGRDLLAAEPVFAGVIDVLDPVFVEEMGVSPRAALLADEEHPVDVVQPLIFAVQTALAALWRHRGLTPDAVLGHSVGEIAAAVTAGILTLEQGARLVCRRSLLLRRAAGRGAMAMVSLSAQEAGARLAGRQDVVVAISASPGSTVVSGDAGAVAEVGAVWRADGVAVRPIDTDVAFHSPHMEPLLEELAAAAEQLPPSPASLPVYSTALPDPRDTAPRDGRYWAANLGRQVRFEEAVTAAAEDGYRLFLEVSPHPVVEHSVNETLEDLGLDAGLATHSLRRRRGGWETMLANLGQLYCHGARIDWSRLWPDGGPVDLPGTAWQHKPYWFEEPAPGTGQDGGHDPGSHTLLGARTVVNGTTPLLAWRTRLDRDSRPYPGSHPVREVEIIPAAVLLHTFLTAGAQDGRRQDLVDVALRVPVSVTRPREVQVTVQDGTVRLASRILGEPGDERSLTTHTTASFEPHEPTAPPAADAADAAGPADLTGEELPPEHVVERLAELGVAAMGFFWQITGLCRGAGTLSVQVRADADTEEPPATWAPLLDAALSAASVLFPGPPALRMPAHIGRVSLEGEPPARAEIRVRLVDEATVDVHFLGADGALLGRLQALRYGRLDGGVDAPSSPRRLVHRMEWRALQRDEPRPFPSVVLLGDDRDLLRRLTHRLVGESVPHRVADGPQDLREDELRGGHAVLVVPAARLPAETLSDASLRTSWLLARTAQRMAAAGSRPASQLWCLTRGVRECAGEESLAHSPLWGLARIIAGEHPDLWGGLVDVGTSPRDIATAVDLLGTRHGEGVLTVREGRAEVPRLALLEGDPGRQPTGCRPHGTYLVTGGLGTLGLEVARWLAGRGARRIVLCGRRALPPREEWDSLSDPGVAAQVEAVRALERLGTTVATVALDVCDAEAAQKLLTPNALGLPPIRGLVHAAGVLEDRPLRTLDAESLRTVLRPKAEGAWVLHELFPPGTLDFFVLFSSCGQLLGLPGQSAYAAANSFLDALAAHRRAAGDAGTVSFGWTSWRGLGMSTASEVIDAELEAHGTGDITALEAFRSWELAERHDLGYAAVLRTLPCEPGRYRPPLLDELPDQEAPAPPEAVEAAPWAKLAGQELHTFLSARISGQVASETRLSAEEIDPHRALSEMGLDSVMTVRIRRGLEKQFRTPLPATLFWDRPTVHAIAGLLAERIHQSEADTATAGEGSTP